MKSDLFPGMMDIWRWAYMAYKSYVKQVKDALGITEKEICDEMGTFLTAEAQVREPVLTGNMKRSTTYEVIDGNKGIDIGVTADAPYAPCVEKGTSKQQAQPFLEPAVMENIAKLEKIAKQKLIMHMGGD
jgi:HK97 gp10 family phage protein